MSQEDITAMLLQQIAALTEKINAMTDAKPAKKSDGVPKSHVPSKPQVGRTYVRLMDTLPDWGKVPQQQADLAKIMVKHMVKGEAYSEADVFDMVLEHAAEYPSLASSRQSADYLFRYYRGLNKKDGKHVGFIGRKFLQQIG